MVGWHYDRLAGVMIKGAEVLIKNPTGNAVIYLTIVESGIKYHVNK